jgi:hypothetical protein
MIQFGTIVTGQTVSSAFELRATDRSLLVGINSHAALIWYAAFQATPGGPFLRFFDPWSAVSGALLAGVGMGGWGMIPSPPATTVRIETSAAVSATTSFQLVEAVQG